MIANPGQENKKVLELLQKVAEEGINHAVEGLSQMVEQKLVASRPEVSFVNVLDVPNMFGGPETEAVGIYLQAEGEMSGQFMLILAREKALQMVDMLMGDPPGTSTELEGMGRSALAEVGNLTGAFFLNEISRLIGLEARPTPPAVMFDMVGAVLNVIVATSAQQVDEVVMITTKIVQDEREAQANFWYIPDLNATNLLLKSAKL